MNQELFSKQNKKCITLFAVNVVEIEHVVDIEFLVEIDSVCTISTTFTAKSVVLVLLCFYIYGKKISKTQFQEIVVVKELTPLFIENFCLFVVTKTKSLSM